MKPDRPIDPERFVSLVQPLLEKNDAAGLCQLLKTYWSPQQIVSLLTCACCDARKVAALALSYVGGKCVIKELVPQLRDPDPMVNQMAEHALWSIWLRCGKPEANHEVCRGCKALNRRDYEHAISHFSRAIQIDATFAEAYNQRALAHYLQESFEASVEDCLRTVELMPCHFGAWAGLGHSYMHLDRLEEARRAYEKALEINPHLSCLKEALEELNRKA